MDTEAGKVKIAPEKRKQYDKTKSDKDRRNRLLRKEEKKNNTTDTRRLAFLSNIMKAYGHNQKTIADALGCTQQNIYWIFSVRDDCQISRAEEILAICGLTLEIKLENTALGRPAQMLRSASFVSGDVVNRLEADLPITLTTRSVNTPDYIRNCPEGARMRFLADYINETGRNVALIESKAGMSRGNVVHFFQRDDMAISKLYDIAKGTGAEITWKIQKK